MQRPLSLRDIALFFLPLAFTAELMMVSHSIIHATLARLGRPTESLAAFSIAFSVHTILSAPTVIAPFTGLAFLRDRHALERLLRFHGVIMAGPIGMALAIGLTPLGDLIFGGMLGASAPVIVQARRAILIFSLVHPIIALRAIPTALLMLHRRTLPITYGTGVRIVALGGFLLVVPRVVAGAAGGVLSLVLCIGVETLFMFQMARGLLRALPAGEKAGADYGMWGFAWPLMLSQLTEGSLTFVTNVFIGRLARADLALAAFGVVRGLAMLLLIPLRNMAQTAQALVRTREEVAVLMRFTLLAVLAASGIILILFWSPLRALILDGVMGLPDAVSRYGAPGARAMLLVPVVWGYAALFRGLLSGLRSTKAIGLSALFKLSAVVLVGAWALIDPMVNGVVLGMAALAAAFGAESLVLGWGLFFREGKRP